MFVILVQYIQSLRVVEKYRQAHHIFLDEHYAAGHFLSSGAQVPLIGGVILAKNLTREELAGVLNEDPYYREKLATYQVIEFNPTKCAAGAEEFFDKELTGER